MTALAAAIVDCARALDAAGLNRGASGNVSARDGEDMLVTPSAVPAADLAPGMIARMPLAGDGGWSGPLRPSSEWRIHRDLYRARPDFGAVVHTHAPWCTALAAARRPIPPLHYMIAAFGGSEIRVAGYARYGTPELSGAVLAAMAGRAGCLMANHGMIVGAATLARAAWLAGEMEALAQMTVQAGMAGGAHLLTEAEIAEAMAAFAGYRPEATGEGGG